MFSSVCNFQSIKNFVELNSLFSKFFCYITWFVISLRRDSGRLANEAFTSNPIVSWKQQLNRLKTVLWILQILQNAPVSCFRRLKTGNFFAKKSLRLLLLYWTLNMPLHMIRVFTLKGFSEQSSFNFKINATLNKQRPLQNFCMNFFS